MKLVDDPPGLFKNSIPLTCKEGGVYAIVNRNNSRMYIGGTQNFSHRRSVHKIHFRKRKHAVKELQTDILNDPGAFEFVIIETVPRKEQIRDREQFWLDFFQAYLPENGYNRCRSAHSVKGFKHDEAFRQAVSRRFSGKKRLPFSEEWRNKMSEARKGVRQPHSHKPVIQYDLAGNELRRFDCVSDAAVSLGGLSKSGGLVATLKGYGNRTTAYGFKWKYA